MCIRDSHCGNGVSQQDVHFRTFPAAQVLAEKMWRGKNEMVDVYKRQANIEGKQYPAVLYKHTCNSIFILRRQRYRKLRTYIPVSYTHLDVYKRQA